MSNDDILQTEYNKQGVNQTTRDCCASDKEDRRQVIFDDIFHKLMDGFGKACQEQNVKIALSIAIHPEIDQPMIFIRGDTLDAMSLMAGILKDYKENIYQRLNTDPNKY